MRETSLRPQRLDERRARAARNANVGREPSP
jgi:hypothetical protein